jgi:hypothetical protein
MRHYRALLNAGDDRYSSINRFEVAHAIDPYEIVLPSSRYSYQHSNVGVGAVFAKGTDLVEACGRAIEVGDSLGTNSLGVCGAPASSLRLSKPETKPVIRRTHRRFLTPFFCTALFELRQARDQGRLIAITWKNAPLAREATRRLRTLLPAVR